MSHRSGSTALQPKILLKEFEKIYAKTDKKELFDEFYECDENYIDNKLFLLKNKNELKYEREQLAEKEKIKIFDKKTEELLNQISQAVEILFHDKTFDLTKRYYYLSPSNIFPGYKSCLIFNFILKSHHSRWSKVF